jgi:group I intron endonuclease
MTEKPNMYHKGKIYKIVNDINDDIYIGSTVKQLSNRMAGHRCKAKTCTTNIYTTMRELGVGHFKIILVEEHKCENKEQLRAREDYYIKLLKPSLNVYGAILDIETRREKHKLLGKKYRETHVEENKEYYINNRQKILDRAIEWDAIHKQETSDRRKLEIVHCDFCNVDIRRDNKIRHDKSKMHQANINNN